MDKSRWGVHETHCCVIHGCKYGDEDCPVMTGEIDQEKPCEACSDYFSQSDGGVEVSIAKIEILREAKRAVTHGDRTVFVSLSSLQLILGGIGIESFDPLDYYYPGDRYIESLRKLGDDVSNADTMGKSDVEVECVDIFAMLT